MKIHQLLKTSKTQTNLEAGSWEQPKPWSILNTFVMSKENNSSNVCFIVFISVACPQRRVNTSTKNIRDSIGSSRYKLCNDGSNAAEMGKGHNLAVPIKDTSANQTLSRRGDVLISLELCWSCLSAQETIACDKLKDRITPQVYWVYFFR